MKHKTIQEAVDNRLGGLAFTNEMKEQTRQRLASPPKRRLPKKRSFVLTAAALGLAMVFGVGVAAGAVPGFERFIGLMGEELRPILQPVSKAVVQNGIRMEVLAAISDGETAVAYLSLADNEGRRIDETTELYSIDFGGGPFSWGTMVHYDEETGEAIYRMEGSSTEKLAGTQTSITIHSILTGCETVSGLDTGLTLADIQQGNPVPLLRGTNQLDADGWPTGSFSINYGPDATAATLLDAAYTSGQLPLLKEGVPPSQSPLPGIEISAAGVVDGLLHLQYRPATEAGRYGLTEFSLQWPGMPEEGRLTTATLGLGKETAVGYHHLYNAYEQMLELPANVPPEDVKILMEGTTCDELIEGGWAIDFTLNDSPRTLVSDEINLDLKGWTARCVSVSSIGVTVYADGEIGENSDYLDIQVYLTDGTAVESNSSTCSASGDDIRLSMVFNRPVSIYKIGRVLLNGEEIPLKLSR